MLKVTNKSLFHQQAYINGRWVEAATGEKMPVANPSTGETIGFVPKMSAKQTRLAIDAANAAWPAWRSKTAKERAAILRRWFELIIENQEDLAVLMTSEQGKPLVESRGEIAYAASFVEWFAEEAKRVYGDVMPAPNPSQRIVVSRMPIGVCAAITPWNFPSAMITRKAAPALAAGCTLVVKPASKTPFSALALAELAHRAGIPAGVFNVVTGDSATIGEELTGNPVVRKLSFTGSTATGKILMKQCADTVKRMSLELGGHAPFIVFSDADMDAAIAGAMASKYRNSGQTCVCANRFLVQDDIHDVFAMRLAQAAKQLTVADGFADGAQQGPMIDMSAVIKVELQIKDAIQKGARLLTGGHRHPLGKTFFEPTVLADVTEDMIIAREETFGPVAPVMRFRTEQEAVRMANNSPYGLAAYLFTKDISRVWRISEDLEYGMVGINTGIMSNEAAPFGGMKQSGFGREGSKYGIEEYLEIKYLCMNIG
ncbi:MAG: NAD-dependent succinate-semialdehyde dehydrogenase [Desulfobacterales bacterium]|jgi:succinate-semialdehyde dehydrogenase/glutarate-semialdehyde dehydrogenase|nr:NAD-dependent succinate-semialdehyde dehydrogenase [Desulfobacterales bacterium]